MPFVVSSTHYPASGKAAELAALAAGRLKERHAKGAEANLAVDVLGP